MPSREPIYLDNNSTTPLDPAVLAQMEQAWRTCGANPASQHGPGRRARRLLEDAREKIAALLGARTQGMTADRLLLTSGGTEANHLALFGLLSAPQTAGAAQRPLLVTSPSEHLSITAAAREFARRGGETLFLRLDQAGCVNPAELQAVLQSARAESPSRPMLVSIMAANHETGVLQPIVALAATARSAGALFHTDAVQAAGKIPLDFTAWGVDALTLTPHKLHGPVGIGGLLVRHGVTLQPQLFGGFQQAGLRPGTENVALAVGFAAALSRWLDDAEARRARISSLRDRLQELLLAGCPQARVAGLDAPRAPGTLNIAFPGVDRQALVMALDLDGVACSTGSACASGSSEPSPTLLAMGLPPEWIGGAIRLSLSVLTTAEEIVAAAEIILRAVRRLSRACKSSPAV